MAIQIVRACHDEATIEMLRQIQSTYTEWHNSNSISHLGIYWNLRIQKFVWINGFYGTQLEVLVPSALGGDNTTVTGFGQNMDRAALRLNTIRKYVVYLQ
jgi:hypothetical protein